MLKPFSLAHLQAPLEGQLRGEDTLFSGVSIDSRSVQPGQLFVALVGNRFDGHDYLAEVAARGAAAALVSQPLAHGALPQLVVADTRMALGQLGALNRAAFDGQVLAITGSSGKTTVKELAASILRAAQPNAVLATQGNLNNDLGVPLTLLALGPEHRSAVIELGASGVGEIAYTVGLTRPHVSLITQAGTAHVGAFGGPERIVQAKGEILDGLAPEGTAVLNLDDPAFSVWAERAGGRRIFSFSLSNPGADFYAQDIVVDSQGCPQFTLCAPCGSGRVHLHLLGQHNIANALGAAAAAHALGCTLADIKNGLEALLPVSGRGQVITSPAGGQLIDDSYNANPGSVRAAVDMLSGLPGQRLLVLGDMGELGHWAQEAHADIGRYARGKVEQLYGVGPLMAEAVEAFGPGGHHFNNQHELIQALRAQCHGDQTLLVKGSRSAAMDRVVAALQETSKEMH